MLPPAYSPSTAGLQAPLPIVRAEEIEMLRAAGRGLPRSVGRAVVVATGNGAAIGPAIRDDLDAPFPRHRQSRGGRVRGHPRMTR